MRRTLLLSTALLILLLHNPAYGSEMKLKKTIQGDISPKSVVYSGNGLFFAQNMMYRHTITVYNHQYQLVKTIPDSVNLAKFGYADYEGVYRGSPVETAFSHDGAFAWVSNYQMYGSGFDKPGDDGCAISDNYDKSFLYRIDTQSLKIDRVVSVGSTPKFVAVAPNNRWVIVSNWCSGDVSVVDTQTNKEVRRVKVGRYPRGIVVDHSSQKAYIAVMGSYNIAVLNLVDYSVGWFKNIGRSPRHLNLGQSGQYLFATLNGEGKVVKIKLATGVVVKKVETGNAPRSMALSADGEHLYVVNYHSNTLSKVRTDDMKIVQTVKTNHHPIGITYDPQNRQIWVSCYSGSIMVFQD